MPITVEELFIYPIKSLGGVSVSKLEFGSFGVKDDRRYMLVNSKHKFVTQRTHSALSQFALSAHADGWQVRAPNGSYCIVKDDLPSDRLVNTEVWGTALTCRETDPDVSNWFSEQLDELVYLVEFDDLQHRNVVTAAGTAPLAFADGYPLLVCNRQSLVDLNSKLNADLSMLRFRPNIVYSSNANSEYSIKGLSIESGGKLYFSKPCVRCNIPAIDPITSVYQRTLHQQLKTLLKRDGSVIFGMNATSKGIASLPIGAKLDELH